METGLRWKSRRRDGDGFADRNFDERYKKIVFSPSERIFVDIFKATPLEMIFLLVTAVELVAD